MTDDQNPVSPDNPCPFLRALVAGDLVDSSRVPLTKLAKTIAGVAKTADTPCKLPFIGMVGVASIANGLGPFNVVSNQLHGVRLNQLRGGPLDKKGAGSRILSQTSEFEPEQIERLQTFASLKTDPNGNVEPGLNEEEVTAFMDANFDRAKGHRRAIDRKLMNGEWPVLLKVLGKESTEGLYLAVADVVELFKHRRFPQRMIDRMD